ncbi:MAG: hypothetical protein M1822_006260 [Bathelium mastoideum]|nr:MAG: hypothetical protein M1822_006260 [Bathelium mastoideum]
MATTSVIIEAATLDDLSALATIHIAAFTNDPAVQIMLTDPAKHEESVIEMLKQQISNPSWFVMKAVDPGTGSVRGWASWLKSGYDDTEQGNVDQTPSSDDDNSPEDNQSKDLRAYVAAQQQRHLGRLMSGKKCLKLDSLFTHPHFQRQGVGTTLLRWGTDVAVGDHVPCYLASTPSAYSVYCANGFQAREWIDIDLRNWGPGGKDGYRGWGNYRFWYMEKLAKNPGPL